MATKEKAVSKKPVTIPVNEVQLTGRLARDPFVQKGSGNTALAVFSVAVTVDRGDGMGGIVSQPHFMDCSFRCEDNAPEWLKKGKAVHLKGHLITYRPKARTGEIHKNVTGVDLQPFPKMVVRVDEIAPAVIPVTVPTK